MSEGENIAGAVGVLMPAGKLFDRVWAEAVAPACAEAGVEGRRIRVEFSHGKAWRKAQREIRESGRLLAEVSGRNPNVLYAIGYAHALGKEVILAGHHGEGPMFDPAENPMIVHAGNLDFLRNELRSVLGNSVGKSTANNGVVAGSVAEESPAREKFFEIFGDILKAHGCENPGGIEMEGEKTFVLVNQDLELALVQDLARKARGLGIRLKLL